MRLHISLDDELVDELDEVVAPGTRSSFIEALVRQALEDRRRWGRLERALGAIDDGDHPWDDDPAAWVRAQRRADERRTG